MKNSIDIQIVCLEHMLSGIKNQTNNFKFSSPLRAAFEQARSERAQEIEGEITELHRQKAPNHSGPFKIRSREKISGHYLYLQGVSYYNPTQHQQDAKIWKTAAGAEKALKIFGENFKMVTSFEIVSADSVKA